MLLGIAGMFSLLCRGGGFGEYSGGGTGILGSSDAEGAEGYIGGVWVPIHCAAATELK